MHYFREPVLGSKTKSISAVRFIRQMRGGSQASLIESSDGRRYIVKWQQNPQGTNVVLNEALGNGIYSAMGLPVPSWEPIEISDSFIKANPEAWPQAFNYAERPRAGFHFASLRIGDPTQTVYEILPGNAHARVQNRADFWSAFVIDTWCRHTDYRQAIFLRNEDTRKLSAIFIDHGHMFGGPDGTENARPCKCLHLDLRIYPCETIDNVESCTELVRRSGEAAVESAFASLHPDWISPAAERIASEMFDRASRIESIIFPSIYRSLLDGLRRYDRINEIGGLPHSRQLAWDAPANAFA